MWFAELWKVSAIQMKLEELELEELEELGSDHGECLTIKGLC
jgi:hypothetical protein